MFTAGFREAFRPLFREVVLGEAVRKLLRFNGLNSFAEMATPWVVDDDFDATFLFAPHDDDWGCIASGPEVRLSLRHVDYGKSGHLNAGDTNLSTGTNMYEVGKINKLRLSRTDGSLSLALNNAPAVTVAHSGPLTFTHFGLNVSTLGTDLYFNGVMLSAHMADLITATNTRTYSFDSGRQDYDGQLGNDLVQQNGDFVWTNEGDYENVEFGFDADINKSYVITIDLTEGTQGKLKVLSQNTVGTEYLFDGQHETIILNGMSGAMKMQCSANSNVYRGRSVITIQELDIGALVYRSLDVNGGDWRNYISTPTGYESGNLWIYDDPTVSDGTEESYALASGTYVSSEVYLHSDYRIRVTANTQSQGWNIKVGNGNLSVRESGQFTAIVNSGTNSGRLLVQNAENPVIGTLSGIEINHLLSHAAGAEEAAGV